jgi:protein BCP1
LQQIFQRDAELFSTNQLTDLILAQSAIGSTIKTDGPESDPYALLTVLNMHIHHQHQSVKAIANYCLEKVAASGDQSFQATLHTLFSQSQHHVGLVICERLINMPVQVIPPMYKMLADELRRAISDVRISTNYISFLD